MITPSAIRAAELVLGKKPKSRSRIKTVAEDIDLYTGLHSTVRTCAIILHDLENSPYTKKDISLKLAVFALRDVILRVGYSLKDIDHIIAGIARPRKGYAPNAVKNTKKRRAIFTELSSITARAAKSIKATRKVTGWGKLKWPERKSQGSSKRRKR